MELIHLPPPVVAYLNTLTMPEVEGVEEKEQFETTLADMRNWLQFERAFSVNDEEQRQLENLGVLLDQVDEHLDGNKSKKELLEGIVPTMYQIVGLMELIRQNRERASYSAQPAVNDLILAGAAYLQGRGDLRGIEERLPRVEAYYQNLRQAFRGIKMRLKPEVVESIGKTIEVFKSTVEELYDACEKQDRTGLQDGLATLKDASEIIQQFIDWQKQDEERLRERHSRFCIPIVGPTLELSLENARQFDREQWRRGIQGIRERALPDLHIYWAQAQRRIILPPEERLEAVDRVEDGMAGLEDALDAMEDPNRDRDEAVQGFEDALQELSDAFQHILDHSLNPSHLRGTQAGDYFELFMGLVQNTVPMVAVPEMLHSSPPPGADWAPIVEPVMRYCMVGEPDHVYTAMVKLLEKYPRPEEAEVPQEWTCPFCGQQNPLGRTQCRSCSNTASAGLEELTSWEA